MANDSDNHTFFSLADLFIIIRHRWVIGLSTSVVFSALLAIMLYNQTPYYEAEATMVVDLSADKVVNVQEVVEDNLRNTSLLEIAMKTHIERLKSRSLANKVAKVIPEIYYDSNVGLDTFGNYDGKETNHKNSLVPLDTNMLGVYWQPDSQILKITFKDSNPTLAEKITNTYVKEYISLQSSLRIQSVEQAVDFLDAQTIDLKKRLEKEEEALQSYRTSNDLVTVEQNQKIVTERLTDISKVITEERLALLGVESYIEQISVAGKDLNQIMNLPFIGGDQKVASLYYELRTLIKNRTILEDTYLELHPKMQENAKEREVLEESLWMAINQSSQEYIIEKKRLSEKISSLEIELNAAKEESRRLEDLAIGYRVLARKVEAQREIFDRITSRFNETSVSQQINSTTIRVLDLAKKPVVAIWPDNKKILLATTLFFTGVFLILPVGLEIFDNRIRTYADIDNYLKKPVLGHIKDYGESRENELVNLCLSDKLIERESWAAIYGSIRLDLGSITNKPVHIVTSSVGSEGKSIVSANLASIFALNGLKTLLIDCDLRRPTQHKYHSLKNNVGLLNWLKSGEPIGAEILKNELLEIVNGSHESGYKLLRSGGSTKNPSAYFEDARMDNLISTCKQEFDIIILDTPPIGVFHDASLLADYADNSLFVTRQNSTTKQKARKSISMMDSSHATVSGVIFNGVKNVRAATCYGNYGSNYSDIYDYMKDEEIT